MLLHGGGYSGLSWSLFVREITEVINCQCLALDIRGHGMSKTNNELDLSADTLATDVGSVLRVMYPENPPNILLVGHSMGGAMAVNIAHLKLIPTLIGCCVIDVVEGTAIESLQSMQSFLRSRPKYFKNIPTAIEWCVRSGQIRNLESAKVSMPSQIINCETKQLAINELPLKSSETSAGLTHSDSIPEESEAPNGASMLEMPTITEGNRGPSMFEMPTISEGNRKYTWRIDLSKSEQYWKGWFEGLSTKFLELNVPKLLILAGIDNLDKTMTVGQMQGKFQLQVLARTGHAVHEDSPGKVAEVIASFLVRNRFAESKNQFTPHMPMC